MSHRLPARWLVTLPAVAALTVAAQTTTAPASSPSVPPATPAFSSALDGYKPLTQEKAVPWKQANETVYRRGGWRAYANEVAEGSKPEASAPGGADPHAGHSMPTPKKEQP